MSDNTMKAQCIHCFHFFFIHSNSTLKNHILHLHCEAPKMVLALGQSSMSRDGSVFVNNLDAVREQFAGLVIQEGLPFNHFDNTRMTRVFQNHLQLKYTHCMSTRSTSSNLFSPLRDPESLIRRRNLGEPSSLFDFEEVMNNNHNNQELPPARPPPPPNNNGPPLVVRPNGPAPRTMEELCQPSINGRGRPFASIPIQATYFGLRHHMIQQQNGVFDDALRLSLFPYSLTHHATAWHQDTINAAAGGTFMQKTPEECYTLIGNMTAHHNHWDTSSTRDETSRLSLLLLLPRVPNKTVANLRGDLKAITTRSGVSYDGPTIPPTPSPLPKNCSTALLKKLPEKLGDLVRFLIPCDFQGLESCMALADLGANINLIPISVWKKLSHPELTSTRMTLELATRTYAYPGGIVEDVFVQMGKFTFPTDFVIIDYDVNPHVPLILGIPFLRTARALVDVHGEELILRNGDEKLIFYANSTSKHPHKHGNESINMIYFIDITCEDRFPRVLKFNKLNHSSSGSSTSLSDFSPSLTPFETSDSLLEEFAHDLALLDPFPLGKEDNNFYFEADLREIKFLLNQDPSTESNIETIDPILKKITNEPSLEYLHPSRDDDDDLFDLKSGNDEWKKLLYGDCYKDINSEKDKNKDSKMKSLVVEAHIVKSNDLLP
nr:reverse transcriptase domain-containing protein [Tanacetum cinerariifolium]